MVTFYVVINTDSLQTVFTGSLEECTDKAKQLALDNPGSEYVYCKVVPVGVHCHNRKMSF